MQAGSGDIAVAAIAAEIVRIHVVVVITVVVIRRLVEEAGARIVEAAMSAGADIVDAGIAREIAAGLVRSPGRTAAAAERSLIAKARLMAAAHHGTDAV